MTTAVLEAPVADSDELSDRVRRPLTLSDRCDGPGLVVHYPGRVPSCGAQAFVRVTLKHGELLFCGHHFAGYEPYFVSAGYDIQDERDRINDSPSPGNADIG